MPKNRHQNAPSRRQRAATLARASLVAALAALTTVAAGCAGESKGESTQGAQRGATGAPGGRAAAGPGTVLAATDIGVVQRGALEAGVPITGDLRPIESVDVKARLEGDLEQVYVREGEQVRQGQLLARFEASQQVSGQRSAEAGVASARAELSTAQWNAEQSAELFRAGAIPERDHRAAQQAVVAAQARLAAAEAQLRSTGQSVGDTRVLAPTTGVVARRLVENDEHVSRGASMFTVVRNDVLELAAAVPSRLAGDVRAGQSVHFVAEGRPLDGKVARVSPTVDPATRAVTVYVQVPNAGGAIKGNTFAAGRVVGRTIPDALLVPTPAIRQGTDNAGRPFVYRLAGDHVVRVPVQVGIVDEARAVAQILDGLQEGDRVVVGNVGTLGEGMKVQVVGEKKN